MFVETNAQYNDGILLDEYNGMYALLSGRKDQEGTVRARWCKPSIGRDQYAAKDIPMGVRLGNIDEAIARMEAFTAELKRIKSGAGTSGGPGPTEDDIPF